MLVLVDPIFINGCPSSCSSASFLFWKSEDRRCSQK